MNIKKIIITTVLAVFTVVAAQAQWAVGGQFGFNISSTTLKVDEGEDVRSPRATSFNIAPMAAYKVGERTKIGLHPDFSQRRITEFLENGNRVTTDTRFGLNAFALFNYFSFGRVNLLAMPSVGFGIANDRSRIGSNDADHIERVSDFGISVTPVVDFHVNERIMLIARFNFMSLGFSHVASRRPGDSDDRRVTNTFGFNFNNMDVVRFGGASHLTIGFLLKL